MPRDAKALSSATRSFAAEQWSDVSPAQQPSVSSPKGGRRVSKGAFPGTGFLVPVMGGGGSPRPGQFQLFSRHFPLGFCFPAFRFAFVWKALFSGDESAVEHSTV